MAETVKASNIEVISAVDLAKRYLGDTPEAQEATREDVMSQLSPEQREVAQHMMDKMENWLKDNPMLLYGEKDGKPFIYELTDYEHSKILSLDEGRRDKYIQQLYEKKEADAAVTSNWNRNGDNRQAQPLSFLVPLLEKDCEGAEYIKSQVLQARYSNSQMNIDDIHVVKADELLVKLNDAGIKEHIPQETLDRLNNRYLMLAEVNGHVVSHVVDKETYDRFSSLDKQQRLDEFCKTFGVSQDITKTGEYKKQELIASNGQKFSLLELLKALLQAFGFIPEQERKADVKNDIAETQQNRLEQQEQKQQSTTVDRSIAAQAKALSEANIEALVADQQQSQQNNRGLHF